MNAKIQHHHGLFDSINSGDYIKILDCMRYAKHISKIHWYTYIPMGHYKAIC